MKIELSHKTIEDRALEFLKRSEINKISLGDSIHTLVDTELYGKNFKNKRKTTSLIKNSRSKNHSNKSKKCQNTIIKFYKVPPKILGDDVEEEEEIFEFPELKEPKKLKNSKKLFFPLNYENIYDSITEVYFPLIKNLESIQTLKISSQNLINKLDIFFKHTSIFDINNNKVTTNLTEFLDELKSYELIEFSLIILLIQIAMDLKVEFIETLLEEDIFQIYKETLCSLQKLYEILMFLLHFNDKNKTQEKIKNSVSFESLCNNYLKDFLKTQPQNLTNEQIIDKINDNKFIINKSLTICITKINKSFDIINQDKENKNILKDLDNLVNAFKDSNLYLMGDKIQNYKQLKPNILLFFTSFKNLVEENKVKVPYLPPINSKKYTYTLVVDLDETLVHYVEEENRAFVQVRPYADYFLNEMGKYFEIVIFTAAAEDYADIVLNELDKSKAISYKLYRRHTEPTNGVFLKDLSKLGRDMNKMCIIDNNKDNFTLQPENGLQISTFLGDQKDDELLILCEDLMRIIKSKKNDIRPVIKEIDEIMKKRYIRNCAILE